MAIPITYLCYAVQNLVLWGAVKTLGTQPPAPSHAGKIEAASKGILVGDNDSLEFQSGGNPLSVSIQIAGAAIDTTVLAHRYGAADTFLGIILDIQDRLGSANSWIPTSLQLMLDFFSRNSLELLCRRSARKPTCLCCRVHS
jgi:hypothetical protein